MTILRNPRTSARSSQPIFHNLPLHSLWLAAFLILTATALPQKPPTAIAANLNPATTSVHWTLNTTLHTVHGTFKLKHGTFRVDPATGDASGLLVIDATSAESGDTARDEKMHRDVLDSAHYPEITFRPTHVDGRIDLTAPGPVTVNGILTLHSQNHVLQLLVTVEQHGSSLHLTTHFDLPYVAWGLKDPSVFVLRVDKQVTLDVDMIAPLNP